MRVYSVYQPANLEIPGDTGAEEARAILAEKTVFVRDKFHWFAALIPVVWLLRHRIWWGVAIYLVIVALLEGVIRTLGLPEGTSALGLGLNLLVGLEASTIRQWQLGRNGMREVGVVSGASLEECEARFFLTRFSPPVETPKAPGGSLPGPATPRRTSVPVTAGRLSSYRSETRH